MGELESLSGSLAVRRSSRLVKNRIDDIAELIILEDDSEEEVEKEEEEWEPGVGRKKSGRGMTKRSEKGTGVKSTKQEEVDGKHTSVKGKGGSALVGEKGIPVSFWPIFGKNEESKLEILSGAADAVSDGLGLLNLSNNDKRNSSATGIDLGAVPQELVVTHPSKKGTMERSFVRTVSQQVELVDPSFNESSDDEDEDDSSLDYESEGEQEVVTTLSLEDSALFAEVMKVIREGGDLKKLKVEELKTYLRHHGLRMVGLKAVLLSRIEEHLRIKDGRAEDIYPRSSFSINCKGDVCLGDTVLFLQNVHDMPFDIQRRGASSEPLGKRWVAGKVVNESYGAGKQQHTFTIEVLWSTGTRPFYVMRPLLIKGRNLYRMSTRRQLWVNEAERQKVLDEKHSRGAEARAIRRAALALKPKGKSKSRPGSRGPSHNRNHPAAEARIPSTFRPQDRVPVHSHSRDHPVAEAARIPPMIRPQDRAVVHSHAQDHPAAGATWIPPTIRPQDRAVVDSRARDHPVAEAARIPPTIQPQDRGAVHSQARDYPAAGVAWIPRTMIPPHHSMQHERIHTQQHVYRGSFSAHPGPPNHGRGKGMPPGLACSNSGCENSAAKQCVTRSCAPCCYRNSSTRGKCSRHI